jgi:hypothetical protein
VEEDELQKAGTEVFDNSEYVQERRKEMLSGVRHADCSYCWKLEEKNIFHSRQRSDRFEDFLSNAGYNAKDFWHPQESQQIRKELLRVQKLDSLEILLKNTCQMKCHYCNANFSSSWEKENRSLGQSPLVVRGQAFQEKFLASFWNYLPAKLRTLTEINVIGGEPLLQKEFFDLLDKIADYKKQNPLPRLTIYVVSNMSVPEKHLMSFLNKAEELKSVVDFCLLASMDCAGGKAEYVRFGLDWSLYQKNIEKACASGLFKTIRHIVTMSALNLTSLHSLLVYFEQLAKKFPQQEFDLISNVVNEPAHLSPLILDASLAKYLNECIDFLEHNKISSPQNQQEFSHFLEGLRCQIALNTAESFSILRAQFVSWIEHYDQIRKTHFSQVFPELSTIFEAWKSNGHRAPV